MKTKLLLAATLLAASSTASAAKLDYDKQLHFLVSGGLSLAIYAATEDRELALYGTLAIGAVRELSTALRGGHFSGKDMIANAAGAYAGYYLGSTYQLTVGADYFNVQGKWSF